MWWMGKWQGRKKRKRETGAKKVAGIVTWIKGRFIALDRH